MYPSYIDNYNNSEHHYKYKDKWYKDWYTAHLELNEDPTKKNDSKYWANQYAEQAAVVHNSDELESSYSGSVYIDGSDESQAETDYSQYFEDPPHEFGVFDITYLEHNEDLEDSDNSDVSHPAEDCDCKLPIFCYRFITAFWFLFLQRLDQAFFPHFPKKLSAYRVQITCCKTVRTLIKVLGVAN